MNSPKLQLSLSIHGTLVDTKNCRWSGPLYKIAYNNAYNQPSVSMDSQLYNSIINTVESVDAKPGDVKDQLYLLKKIQFSTSKSNRSKSTYFKPILFKGQLYFEKLNFSIYKALSLMLYKFV